MEEKSKISHPPPNLPPIWPLEQARGVRGRVVHGSLGVAEVVVGAAESVGRLTQEKGAHRPRRSRNGPGWEDFGGTPLRLSHLRFKMKTLGGPGAPLTVSRLLRFVFKCVGGTKSRFSSAGGAGCRTALRLVLACRVSMETAAPESQWK